jgi:hypothetical protein
VPGAAPGPGQDVVLPSAGNKSLMPRQHQVMQQNRAAKHPTTELQRQQLAPTASASPSCRGARAKSCSPSAMPTAPSPAGTSPTATGTPYPSKTPSGAASRDGQRPKAVGLDRFLVRRAVDYVSAGSMVQVTVAADVGSAPLPQHADGAPGPWCFGKAAVGGEQLAVQRLGQRDVDAVVGRHVGP